MAQLYDFSCLIHKKYLKLYDHVTSHKTREILDVPWQLSAWCPPSPIPTPSQLSSLDNQSHTFPIFSYTKGTKSCCSWYLSKIDKTNFTVHHCLLNARWTPVWSSPLESLSTHLGPRVIPVRGSRDAWRLAPAPENQTFWEKMKPTSQQSILTLCCVCLCRRAAWWKSTGEVEGGNGLILITSTFSCGECGSSDYNP